MAACSPRRRNRFANSYRRGCLIPPGTDSPASSLLFGILLRSAYLALAIPENARCDRLPMVGRLCGWDGIFGLRNSQWQWLRTMRSTIRSSEPAAWTGSRTWMRARFAAVVSSADVAEVVAAGPRRSQNSPRFQLAAAIFGGDDHAAAHVPLVCALCTRFGTPSRKTAPNLMVLPPLRGPESCRGPPRISLVVRYAGKALPALRGSLSRVPCEGSLSGCRGGNLQYANGSTLGLRLR